MRLLVVGGSGFFGKSILDAFSRGLLAKFNVDELVVMSRSANLLAKTVPYLVAKNVSLVDGNIASCKSLPSADYVIHAASSTDVRDYLNTPDFEKRNITLGASNFTKLISAQHEFKKVLYCSSGAVYGHCNFGVNFLSESDILGDATAMPLHKQHYAFAKRVAEKAICDLGRLGREVSIARCFSFVGKYLPLDQHFAIGNFIHDAIYGDVIRVKADKLVYRSYLYADDLVEWLMKILLFSNKSCPIFNVGSDHGLTTSDLALMISKKFNKDICYENKISDEIDCYLPCINKITKTLGVSVTSNIDISIDLTVKALAKGA